MTDMERFIDVAVEQFARDHTEPETELYVRLREETYRVMKWPEMQVDAIEGRFLKMLVRLTGARTVLELGMFTGYSTLMMAEALPDDGSLITCEIDPKAEAIARRYFAESPHGHKITIQMGPALDTIKTLTGPLDLIFIDADKANYSNYYEACVPLLKPGGLIVGDNVLWSGKVVDPKDADDYAIVAFDCLVQSDSRVENVCLTDDAGLETWITRAHFDVKAILETDLMLRECVEGEAMRGGWFHTGNAVAFTPMATWKSGSIERGNFAVCATA